MERPVKHLRCGLIAASVLVLSACGGGGGGGGSGSQASVPSSTRPPEPAASATPTPLRAVPSRNERTEASDSGSITLRVQDIELVGGQTTSFSVFLFDAKGRPAPDQPIAVEAGSGLKITLPGGNRTRSDGSVSGTLQGLSGGRFALTVGEIDPQSP